MKQRLRKDGTPRREYVHKHIGKPVPGCMHVWKLHGCSTIPKCDLCHGEALPGTWLYATAVVTASMSSDRGTIRTRYVDPRRDND